MVKVRELIEKLSGYNPEAVVSIRMDDVCGWLERVRGIDSGTVELAAYTDNEEGEYDT